MRPSGRSRTRPSRCPSRREADAESELKTLLDRTEGERPWQIRDELAETMHENFGVFRREEQMQEQGEIVEALRERYERVVVEDKGDVFNNDLTQALELGYLLELADVHGRLRARAEGEPRRARAPVRLSRPRRRELPPAHIVTWADGAPQLDWKPVTMTKWQPAERTY